jgi:hypothetical protein
VSGIRNLPYPSKSFTPGCTDGFDIMMRQIPYLSTIEAGIIGVNKFSPGSAVNLE